MEPVVTFIVPTLGRASLRATLESLQRQTCPAWRCLVGFDGIPVQKLIDDVRIQYISLPKVGGCRNFGGAVRNKLLDLAVTPWAAFVDDDDTVRPSYVQSLQNELVEHPNANTVVFRMSYDTNDRRVLPPLGQSRVEVAKVGISFASRMQFLKNHNIRFRNGSVEDYQFLRLIERRGGPIIWSNNIEYNVRF